MKPWELRTPYAVLAFSAETPGGRELFSFLEKLPGAMKQRSGVWWVPDNALGVVAAEQTRLNVHASAKWGIAPKPEKSWEEIHDFLVRKGEIREEFLGEWLKPYQKVGVTRAWTRPGFCLFHATGSGKTATGLIAATAEPGPILVVTRASVRRQYYREIERFTHCKAYVILPEGQMSPRVTVGGVSWALFRERQIAEKIPFWKVRENWAKLKEEKGIDRHISLQAYLAQCEASGQRPFVVVAWENLKDRLAELEALRPGTLVLDESHTARNSKRYLMTSLQALPKDPAAAHKQALLEFMEAKAQGGFVKTNEITGERMMFTPLTTTAAATARLARMAKKVIGTTATPVSNRVADLWSQLDAVEPNAHGPAAKWLDRHAGRKPGKYGGFEAKGETNREELDARLRVVSHVVSKAEAAKFMPEVRRVSMYIGPEDLTRPSAGFNAELKKAFKRGPTAVLEVRLAMAAAMKRTALIELVVEHLKNGNKVTVFTGRRNDCDVLGADIRKAIAKEIPDCTVWAAHGEMNTEARQLIVDEAMTHPGPCCLVGTGDAFGTGVNLDTMDSVIFAMLPYTPEKIIQQEGRFCVAEGQWVPTLNGSKLVEDVVVGDWVFTHAGRARPVTKTHTRTLKRSCNSPEDRRRYTLTTLNLAGIPFPLRLTTDHKVLVSIDEAQPTWVEAGRVTAGDELVTPRLRLAENAAFVQVQFPSEFRVNARTVKNGRFISMPDWIKVDEDVAWLFGHFLGDGWTSASTTHYVGIASNIHQVDGHLARVKSIFEGWGVSVTIRPASRGKGMNLYAYGKEVALWFRSMMGAESKLKRVPSIVYTWPKNLVEAFLRGYWDADGHSRPGRGEQSWDSVSSNLAYGVFLLESALGRPVKLYCASGGQFKGSTSVNSNIRVDDSFIYRRVRGTETPQTTTEMRSTRVYDLTVEGDESFVVNGVVVHNCRNSTTKKVAYYYVIAEGTVDEHVACILLDKLPTAKRITGDEDLQLTMDAIAGKDPQETEASFAASILACLDLD